MSKRHGKRMNIFFMSAVVVVFAVLSVIMTQLFFESSNNNGKEKQVSAVNNAGQDVENGDMEINILGEHTVQKPIVDDEAQKPSFSTVSFAAVGDNIIHSSVMADAKDNAVGFEKEFDFIPMYSNVADVIKNADLAFINHEAPVAGKSVGYSGYPMFNSPEQAAYDLVNMGFDIINIANNHMLDKRTVGYRNTIDFWKSIDDITYIGGYENKQDYNNIRIVEKNGIKIAFLSYTYGTNGMTLDSSSEMVIPLCDQYSNAEIDRQTKEARKLADIVMVSVHWGNEDWFEPSWLQKQQMEIMVNNNVDVIIGTHPHVLEPMLWKERPDGKKTLVIYSLGNFLSGMEYMRNHVGGIAGFDLIKAGDETYISNVYFIPTLCHFDKNVRKFKIYRFSEYTQELLSQHGTQVRGTDSRRDMQYLRKIIDDTISKEFLTEEFYKTENEEE